MKNSRRWIVATGVVLAVALVGLWSATANAALRFVVESAPAAAAYCPSESVRVRVRVRNVGDQTWSVRNRDFVSYHWLDASGATAVFEGHRTALPTDVLPGGALELPVVLVAPAQAGDYQLQWAMVRDQVGWYGSDALPVGGYLVKGAGPALAWSMVGIGKVPTDVPAKSRLEIPVTVRNEGCAAWDGANGDALSYRRLDSDGRIAGEGPRTLVPVVAPGGVVTLKAKVEAPAARSEHVLMWELVREHIAWFGPPRTGRRDTTLRVGRPELGWSLLGTSVPEPIHAGQTVAVELRLRNEGRLAWRDLQGDRIAYHWVDGAGVAVVDEGIRSVLPHDVEPGQDVAVSARVTAPSREGEFHLIWEPVREGQTWFGAPEFGPWRGDRMPPPISVRRAQLAWDVVEVDLPWALWRGRRDEAVVTVRNTGAVTWSEQAGDRLSYRWRRDDGQPRSDGSPRARLSAPVEPGQFATFKLPIIGPATGDATLDLAMVREHVRWYPPPDEPSTARLQVPARWFSVWVGGALFVVFFGWVGAMRWSPRRRGARGWSDDLVWPVWMMLATYVLTEAFSDLGAVRQWKHATWTAWSAAGLVALPVALLPKRWQPAVALSLVGGLTLLVVADLAYVEFFGGLLPLEALAAVHHLSDASGTVMSLIKPRQGWLVLVVLSGFALVALARTRSPDDRRRGPARWVPALIMLAVALPAAIRIGILARSELGIRIFSEQANAGRLGVVAAHVFQAARALRSLGGPKRISDDQRARLEAWLAQRADPRDASTFGIAHGQNAVLVQVEALQDWVIGATVQGQPVTPFLNAAHRDAMYFGEVFDQTAQGRTSDAEYLVLASGHPLAEGALSFLRQGNTFVTVAHALSEQGYATLSAHPYKRGFWNRATTHPRYGFERSLFRRELGDGPVVGWGMSDEVFLQRLVGELAQTPEPFMAFGITLSLHHPYESFPTALKVLDLGSLEGTRVGNYLHAMNHADRALAGLFDRLGELGLADRTAVMVYGDHVTGLPYEREILGLAREPRWDPSVATRLRRVPAFLWVPGADLRGISERIGGQIDLGVTLLHALGVAGTGTFVGQSLLQPMRPFVALPDGSAVGRDRIFVARGLGIGPHGDCFDYPSGSARPRADCDDIAALARQELMQSRLILDHDVFAPPR